MSPRGSRPSRRRGGTGAGHTGAGTGPGGADGNLTDTSVGPGGRALRGHAGAEGAPGGARTGGSPPASPAPGPRQPAVELPTSGLAAEILAAFDRQAAAAGGAAQLGPKARPAQAGDVPAAQPPTAPDTPPAEPGAPPAAAPAPAPAPSPAVGPARIYSFADTLERREAAPAAPVERPESSVVFELAGELYALPVARIQEIQRAHGITRVPHAPEPVRGIANLRGRVLVVVDLRRRLGLPPAEIDDRSRILVVSSRERSLGLLVDATHQVVGLLPSRIEPPPADLVDERSAYLAGVVQLDDKLVIVLDIDQLLLVPEDAGAQTETETEPGGPS
jgi:purine-binding chemotaxis protein CheW